MDKATLKAKYGSHTLEQVNYALTDIKETLEIWKETETDYTRKLWSEWDYLVVRKQRMVVVAS